MSSNRLDSPWGAYGVDWVEQWTKLVSNNDMVNSETGEMDPRHMFGMTGQDVFRWPALANGTQRQLLGFFITMLEMPGIPMVFFGEEQASYILENHANDYVFGRTPMASQRAWQLHGCYHLGETGKQSFELLCPQIYLALESRDTVVLWNASHDPRIVCPVHWYGIRSVCRCQKWYLMPMFSGKGQIPETSLGVVPIDLSKTC